MRSEWRRTAWVLGSATVLIVVAYMLLLPRRTAHIPAACAARYSRAATAADSVLVDRWQPSTKEPTRCSSFRRLHEEQARLQ